MIRLKAAACAAMVLAGTAIGQTRPTSATYEMRLVPQGAAAGLTSPVFSFDIPTTISFVVQARATTAAATTNFGIHRLSSGLITASNATLTRGISNGTNFGRFRGPGLVNNFAAQPAAAGTNSLSGNAAALDPSSNVNGRLAADGRSIAQIDAWRGAQTSSSDSNGDPIPNPFLGTLVTDGTPSAWANLYSFTLNFDPSAGATGAAVSVTGFLNIAAFYADVGGNWTADLLASPTPVTASFFFPFPTPSAAALLGMGGLAAARRRR